MNNVAITGSIYLNSEIRLKYNLNIYKKYTNYRFN